MGILLICDSCKALTNHYNVIDMEYRDKVEKYYGFFMLCINCFDIHMKAMGIKPQKRGPEP